MDRHLKVAITIEEGLCNV